MPSLLENGGGVATAPPADLESITPYKLTLLALICQYCEWRGQRLPAVTAQLRQDSCQLLLRLLQGPELSGRQLRQALTDAGLCRPLLDGLRRRLQLLHAAGLEGLVELVGGAELLIVEQGVGRAPVACSSLVGFFLRAVILAYARLAFHQVVAVFEQFSAYYATSGFAETTNVAADSSAESTTVEWEMSAESILKDSSALPGLLDDTEDGGGLRHPSHQQAALAVSAQIELLQLDERRALQPAALQRMTSRLLEHLPGLAEAHYLNMLNCLRAGELCGALHSLYQSFDRAEGGASGGLRHAALALAALHARFGHRPAALAALGEALTMARDSGDGECVRSVCEWLCAQLQAERDPATRQLRAVLLRRCATAGGALAVLSYARAMSESGALPAGALQCLSEQPATSSGCGAAAVQSLRAAICRRHGRPALSTLCCQLLLLRRRACDAAAALSAVCAVSEALAADGRYSTAEACLRWAAEQLVCSTTDGADGAAVLQQCRLELETDRQLLAGNFSMAESAARQLLPLDPTAARLRLARVQLLLGQLAGAEQLLSWTVSGGDVGCPETQVRQLMARGELLTAAADPAAACERLLEAVVVCRRLRLRTAELSVLLRLAHAQYELGLREHAHRLLTGITLDVLTHGSVIERARLRLLLALCLQHEAPQQALQHLDQSVELLQRIEAWLLLKRVLYMKAELLDSLGDRKARNAAASQFRQLVTQYQTVNGPHLTRIL